MSSVSKTVTAGCGAHLAFHLWAAAPDGTKAHQLVKGAYYGPPSWARASETVSAPAPMPVAKEQPAPAPPGEQEPAPVADQPPASASPPAATAEPAKPQEPPAKTSDRPAVGKGLYAVRGTDEIYL